jgi:DNA-binding transcriptional MerR regulator
VTDETFSLKDLCRLADVTPRTVHFYIQQGLLPPAGSRGPGARYGEGHLLRLRLVRRLQREHLPLAEIRQRLETMTDNHVAVALAESEALTSRGPGDSALDYVRGLLARSVANEKTGAPAPARARSGRRWGASTLWRGDSPELGTSSGATVSTTARDVLPRPAVAPAAPRDAAAAAPPPLTERSQWDRVVLAPDVELHVRRPLTRDMNRRVEKLLDAAREILKEE